MTGKKLSRLVALVACVGVVAGCANKVGVRYTFEIQRPDGDIISRNQGFMSGERFRIRLMPEQDCYVYILHQGSDGAYSLLFPITGLESGNNFLREDTTVLIPSAGWYRLDAKPGVEKMFVLACSKNIAEADSLRNRKLTPDDVKLVLKAVDEVYNLRKVRNSTHGGYAYTLERAKSYSEFPVLKFDIDMTHQ